MTSKMCTDISVGNHRPPQKNIWSSSSCAGRNLGSVVTHWPALLSGLSLLVSCQLALKLVYLYQVVTGSVQLLLAYLASTFLAHSLALRYFKLCLRAGLKPWTAYIAVSSLMRLLHHSDAAWASVPEVSNMNAGWKQIVSMTLILLSFTLTKVAQVATKR